MPEPNEPHNECEIAKVAAGDDPVEPIKAANVKPNMILLHDGRFLQVKYVNCLDRSVMIDYYAEQGMTACRVVAPNTTLYRRVPTPCPARVGATE